MLFLRDCRATQLQFMSAGACDFNTFQCCFYYTKSGMSHCAGKFPKTEHQEPQSSCVGATPTVNSPEGLLGSQEVKAGLFHVHLKQSTNVSQQKWCSCTATTEAQCRSRITTQEKNNCCPSSCTQGIKKGLSLLRY